MKLPFKISCSNGNVMNNRKSVGKLLLPPILKKNKNNSLFNNFSFGCTQSDMKTNWNLEGHGQM
jgi:hypothetical protein